MAARGELPEDAPDDADHDQPAASTSRPGGGILGRLFPPAPPLPNRPDPLAGFDGTGPMRPITSRLYLLRRNPLAWIVPGILAFIGLSASLRDPSGVLGLFGTFLVFGALIGAGWFGWQRPTLFGISAALLGFVVAMALVLFSFASLGATPETFGPVVLLNLFVQALYQSALGFLGGWYGGYLRRRQTQLSGQRTVRPRRR